MTRSVAAMLALLLSVPLQAADPAQALADCMRANFPPAMKIQGMELVTTPKSGAAKTMRGRVFVSQVQKGSHAGQVRTMLRIDEPANLKGAAYLVAETDDFLRDGMYVYAPAVGRVRRVTGTFADGALMGSDFSYYDYKQLQSAFGDMKGQPGGQEEVDGRPADVVTYQPLPSVETRYTSVKAWIDRAACVPVRAEFYEGPKVVKRLTSPPGALQQSGKYWYLSEIRMEGVPEGSRSVLKMSEVTSGGELPAVYFNPQSFYLAN
ncbi:MAG TPA: outer membrane lipoprotein-sorting protein [Candidatus Binatia bacterium]|nr:outer membrane lipoprotein-sorting protein [Candidatus Binatia bacterium]